MSETYKIRPSQVLNIENDYVAFCFDEACSIVIKNLKDKNCRPPVFDEDIKANRERSRFYDDG